MRGLRLAPWMGSGGVRRPPSPVHAHRVCSRAVFLCYWAVSRPSDWYHQKDVPPPAATFVARSVDGAWNTTRSVLAFKIP